jgi:hypothetical protein
MAAELAENKRQVHAVVAQAKQVTRHGAKGPLGQGAQGNIHQARDQIRKSTRELDEVRGLQDELQARLRLVASQ